MNNQAMQEMINQLNELANGDPNPYWKKFYKRVAFMLEELQKDKERLDWLDGFQTGNYEAPYWKIYQVNPGQNLREAIDAAM